jgi:hypothetical protein
LLRDFLGPLLSIFDTGTPDRKPALLERCRGFVDSIRRSTGFLLGRHLRIQTVRYPKIEMCGVVEEISHVASRTASSPGRVDWLVTSCFD